MLEIISEILVMVFAIYIFGSVVCALAEFITWYVNESDRNKRFNNKHVTIIVLGLLILIAFDMAGLYKFPLI